MAKVTLSAGSFYFLKCSENTVEAIAIVISPIVALFSFAKVLIFFKEMISELHEAYLPEV